MNTEADLSHLSESELSQMEKEIARKYVGGFAWGTVLLCFGNLAVWFALWPLVIFHIIPLWLGSIVACANVAVSFLPSHEAQHGNIARPGERFYWLNELVGRISTIPLVFPFGVLKLTHMRHHSHTNDPDNDPDYYYTSGNFFSALWMNIKKKRRYLKALDHIGDTPEIRAAKIEAIAWQIAHLAIIGVLIWMGYLWAALFLWFIPKHVGRIYLSIFLSWAPHRPFVDRGRYRDTRAWSLMSGGGIWNLLSLGMQYHVVHHLHPAIPLFRNGAAYWDMRDILLARGVRNEGL